MALGSALGGVSFGALTAVIERDTVIGDVLAGTLFALVTFAFEMAGRWWRRR